MFGAVEWLREELIGLGLEFGISGMYIVTFFFVILVYSGWVRGEYYPTQSRFELDNKTQTWPYYFTGRVGYTWVGGILSSLLNIEKHWQIGNFEVR